MFQKLFLYFFNKQNFKGELCLKIGEDVLLFGEKNFSTDKTDGYANADIEILDNGFFKRLILFGDVGLGEAFFMREFETSDLRRLLSWFLQNKENLPSFRSRKIRFIIFEWAGIVLKISHALNKNTKKGSKKNIRRHYDVSNRFYELWLDESMTYSSAIFHNGNTLKEAQENKYREICEKLDLKEGDRILEIGCGWGSFAIFAAEKYSCRITAVTISQEQFKYAKEEIEKRGLGDKINLRLEDYRDITGTYDKIVSIEMMEALGHEYIPLFVERCKQLLKDNGKIFLQFITYPDADYKAYLRNNNFIKKYIFPGGELISIGALIRELEIIQGMRVVSCKSIGQDYAKTLECWWKNLVHKKQEIIDLGFDELFFRKWYYYFVYCEMGFASGYLDDVQILVDKNGSLRNY